MGTAAAGVRDDGAGRFTAHRAGGAEDDAGSRAAGTTMAKRRQRDQEMLTVGGE